MEEQGKRRAETPEEFAEMLRAGAPRGQGPERVTARHEDRPALKAECCERSRRYVRFCRVASDMVVFSNGTMMRLETVRRRAAEREEREKINERAMAMVPVLEREAEEKRELRRYEKRRKWRRGRDEQKWRDFDQARERVLAEEMARMADEVDRAVLSMA